MTDVHRGMILPNGLLLIGFASLQLLQLAFIPLVLLPQDARWGWLLLAPMLLTNSWWAFMHEALHGHAFRDKTLGRILGGINAVLFGAAFDLLRAGHLLHHALSRSPRERSEVYVPGSGSRIGFSIAYYFRLLGGLYLFEVLGTLLFLLPKPWIERVGARLAAPNNMVEQMLRRLLHPAALAAVRIEALCIVALYAACFYGYGVHWWMLALALWGRGLLISLMDNVFHYGTALGNAREGRDLALPAWASALILHFNLHGVHHRKAGIPWHALPAQHRQQGAAFQGNFWKAMAAQFRGPIPESALPDHSALPNHGA